MKHIISSLTMIMVLVCSCSCTTEEIAPTENLIIMLSDGTSTSLLSAARWYKSYTEGHTAELNLDPYVCGLVKSYLSDAPIAGSAGAMSGYMTGMPQKSKAISIYPERNPGQDLILVDSTMAHQPLATVFEVAKIEQGKAIGLVATVDFHHATPAACMSHAYDRGHRKEISAQLAAQNLDVLFAGGAGRITGKARQILEDNGTLFIEKDADAFRKVKDGKVWALLADRNLNYEMDREPEKEPSLAEMTRKAIEILSKDQDGFCLMVEGSQVDMAAHANDPAGTITEFLAFDEAVKAALDFAKADGNTTVVILSDHGNSGITLGDRYYEGYSDKGLDSMFLNMSKFRCSGNRLAKLIKDSSNEDIGDIFIENTGITLTPEELKTLIARKDMNVKDYMSVTNSGNLLAAVNSILTSHTHVGFVSGNHTGEDVFLAIYHPKGTVPSGVISNVELNGYLCSSIGLKSSLDEMTERMYARHTDLLKGYDFSITGGAYPKLVINSEGKQITVPAWEAVAVVDSTTCSLSNPSVYIKKNNTFYISRDILNVISTERSEWRNL